ncbi:MAG: multicopper oxidase domain-containing protein [Pseudomonadota bacterium]|nr:multicopper oxidase domain-containing protein [Pseudomonadota bacterium]
MTKIPSVAGRGLAFAILPISLGVATAVAAPVPGGTQDPLAIPKYVTPLVIPPVLFDDGAAPMNVTVALREFQQQVLPTGFPTTKLWGYCDGSQPGTSTCNNPAFTFEVTRDTTTTVTWVNDLVDAQGNFLQHVIQGDDPNNPGAKVPLIDQTLHWAAPNGSVTCDGMQVSDCRGVNAGAELPYEGPVPMVTHVHGAHVDPVSDGYPEAWWLPDAIDIGGYATTGTFYDTTAPALPGSAVYSYTNDQPSTTLWYHDHSLGITRLNVYAAGAGFWLIREEDDSETGVVGGTLPGPAPALGQDPNTNPDMNPVRQAIREIALAIQPKSFNMDGSQYFPADRAFFEGLGFGDTFALNTGLNIPFLPQGTSDIAAVWNPEAFFNTMVVNGKTWPVLDVAPERYRFRVLNAADSRFLNLSLQAIEQTVLPNGKIKEKVLGEMPFYQIGTEQSLLPSVVRIETGFATTLPGDGLDVCTTGSGKPKGKGKGKTPCVNAVPGTFAEQALLVGPAERADVIVDFSAAPAGTNLVRIINTGPDAPFGGFPDLPADPATTGQVMQFAIDPALANPVDPSTPPAQLVLWGNTPPNEEVDPDLEKNLVDTAPPRALALLEEESADLCVTIDPLTGVIDLVPGSVPPLCTGGGVPFAPKAAVLGDQSLGATPAEWVQLWDDPISQNPALDAVETWELRNESADAHPIHLHLVKFEVINREIIGGAVRPAEPWEAGWKDTVIAYPGEITRVRALFDKAGLYVWHCHILSHEDNEMMVPYCVGDPNTDCGGLPVVPGA